MSKSNSSILSTVLRGSLGAVEDSDKLRKVGERMAMKAVKDAFQACYAVPLAKHLEDRIGTPETFSSVLEGVREDIKAAKVLDNDKSETSKNPGKDKGASNDATTRV